MTAPITATTAPAPSYPARYHFTDATYRRGGDVSISANLPDAYVAHLARTQARKQADAGLVDVNPADLNLDAADVPVRGVVDRLMQDYDLVATSTLTITEAVLSLWNSYVSLLGTATTSFTDDDGQTHTVSTVCEIILDPTKFVDTAHRSGHGQSLGLSPEQIQEMTNLTTTGSVITYLNAQCEQAPLVITDLKWKIAAII